MLCCYKIVVMNLWIVTVYPSAPWKLICTTWHSFPFIFRLPALDVLRATRCVFLEMQRTHILPVSPSPSSLFLVESELLFYFFTYLLRSFFLTECLLKVPQTFLKLTHFLLCILIILNRLLTLFKKSSLFDQHVGRCFFFK